MEQARNRHGTRHGTSTVPGTVPGMVQARNKHGANTKSVCGWREKVKTVKFWDWTFFFCWIEFWDWTFFCWITSSGGFYFEILSLSLSIFLTISPGYIRSRWTRIVGLCLRCPVFKKRFQCVRTCLSLFFYVRSRMTVREKTPVNTKIKSELYVKKHY